MYILKIDINSDRTVTTTDYTGGVIGENSASCLKITIPDEYKEFYKYLDIIKSDGTKTQTVVGDRESSTFYYTLPFSLTGEREIIIQLVMKKGNIIFKSNMISVVFNGTIDATQALSNDYQDTIQFLSENKADKDEVGKISVKLSGKAEKTEMLNLIEAVDKKTGEKVSLKEFEEAVNEIHTNLGNRVDNELKSIRENMDNMSLLIEDNKTSVNDLIYRVEGIEPDIASTVEAIGKLEDALNNISTVFDELHNYAQGLIEGGA